MLSQSMRRRDLLTSVGLITYKLYNISTKCVLKRALDLAKIEYYCDCSEFVGYYLFCLVDILSTWTFRRGLNS